MFITEAIGRAARSGRRLFLPFVGHRNAPLRDPKYFLIVALLFGSSASLASAEPLALETDTAISTAGFFQLTWNGPDPAEAVQLRESRHPDLSIYHNVYTGPDLARSMSGKPDGDYYYQLVSVDRDNPQQSNIVKVTVAHHPLVNAFMFFAVGAVVFLAILVSILLGSRRSKA